MKVHSHTLMAMKSGFKMYTQKCYVTLEWPFMLHFRHSMCCPQFVQCAPKCNFAIKSALFPHAAPCPLKRPDMQFNTLGALHCGM